MLTPPDSPRTYRIANLGCKVNQYEGQTLAERLEAAGLRSAADGEPAGLSLVNSCAVTAAAERRSLDAARELRRASPGGRLVLAGCLVSHLGREEALARSGADLALAQDEKAAWPGPAAEAPGTDGSRPSPQPCGEPAGISRFDGHSRAFLKVQDGCAAGCSYCVVPALRGRPRSRPPAEIAAEAARLAADGRRELVLCGTHLGWYGRDLGRGLELADVVEAVLAAAPRARVRLSSLEAGELSARLLELAAGEPRVCPHFHLPLQSGDDVVLRAMNRRGRSGDFLAAVERLRGRLDLPAVTTDVIVGFPGEDRRAFARTLELCRRAGFSRLHVFRFSPRRGTPAAELPGRVPAAEGLARAGELKTLGQELAAAFASACVGRDEEVLAEKGRLAGLPAGYSARYVRTALRATGELAVRARGLYRVRVGRAAGAELFAEVRGEAP
ncbi:MAG TPA: MiaB/RimO family radical SAM methylthiotransferase [Planctomycetota bacterium]|nr:MiaB/RimO family radical SAM methylthiotransferase [Planctomycetota bacterium]